MHRRTEIPVQKIEGFVAQNLDEAASVDLPKAYSQESIPSRRNQIPSPEMENGHIWKGLRTKYPLLKLTWK